MSAKSRYSNRPPKHKYLDKLAALHKFGAFKPGQLSMVDIAHDDWRPKLVGGVCSCNPDVRIRLQRDAGSHN